MDIVIGTIFWVGLLWLTIVWLSRGWTSKPADRRPVGPGAGPGAGGTGNSTGAPAPPTARQLPPDEQRMRVDDALVDGLVIGHFLTRDHYQRRIGELEDSIDEFGHEREPCGGRLMRRHPSPSTEPGAVSLPTLSAQQGRRVEQPA